MIFDQGNTLFKSINYLGSKAKFQREEASEWRQQFQWEGYLNSAYKIDGRGRSQQEWKSEGLLGEKSQDLTVPWIYKTLKCF